MGKYLDKAGLSTLWTKIKSYIKTIVTDKLGVANGIATLDANKKLTTAQLPTFKTINNTSIFGTGNISITAPDIDLSNYLNISIDYGENDVILGYTENEKSVVLNPATVATAGVMTAADKQLLAIYKQEKNSYIQVLNNGDLNYSEDNVLIGEVYDNDGKTLLSVTIDAATSTTAGLMTAADKKLIDEFNENKNFYITAFSSDGTIQYSEDKVIIGEVTDYEENIDTYTLYGVEIKAATTKTAGVMSATDKKIIDKLNNKTYKYFTNNIIINFGNGWNTDTFLDKDNIVSINDEFSTDRKSENSIFEILDLIDLYVTVFENTEKYDSVDANTEFVIGLLSNIKLFMQINGTYKIMYFKQIDNLGIIFAENNYTNEKYPDYCRVYHENKKLVFLI